MAPQKALDLQYSNSLADPLVLVAASLAVDRTTETPSLWEEVLALALSTGWLPLAHSLNGLIRPLMAL